MRQAKQKVAGGKAIIACVHDENGSGKVDTNWLGVPEEGNGRPSRYVRMP